MKKLLSKLVTVFALLVSLFFVQNPVTSVKAEATKKSVFSIDAGRKYFSKDQLTQLIDEVSNAGFTDLHLILGNNGMRFYLDDLSVSIDGHSFTHDQVKNALDAGNRSYYNDRNGTALTQTEMDEILDYAKSKNIKVIPTVNSPGHMTAIVKAMETLGLQNVRLHYNGKPSASTMDISSETARNFTKAFVQKYITYFGSKNTEIFNFGADEYGMDVTYKEPELLSGFKYMQDNNQYGIFIQYMNDMAKMIKAANMKPMAFNDGFYYAENTTSGEIDTDIIVSYWTPGFNKYTPASAKFLSDKGFKILNTNDDWYYVLGREWSGWYNLRNQAMPNMRKSKFDKVAGADFGTVPTIGSMLCVWADTPSKPYDVANVRLMMAEFAKQNPDYIEGPADYSAVDAAIAKARDYDAEDYTNYEVLTDALNKVVRGKRSKEQSEVTKMAEDIQAAIRLLQEKPSADGNKTYVIFSIDAGRKYFSKDQLKQIIAKASENGYTDVQILLGNDGLRFFLDDMSIESRGNVYNSEAVKEALTAGNNAYYQDPNGDHLTQAEMDEILAFADEKNIKVIPVINSPGHMDAILVAMKNLGINRPNYSSSKRTLDINNEDAKAFTKELIRKYAQYFKKHAKVFNLGADEYANDVPGWSGGFKSLLYSDGGSGYTKFINYVNDLAAIVKENGMRPMAFNDGIYYGRYNQDAYGKFDKKIIISYWTAGWSGYDVAKASYLAGKGHKLINTNDAWYWVLGNIDSGGYHYENALKAIQRLDFNNMPSDQYGRLPQIGVMQAVWADTPSADHGLDKIFNLMEKFSEKHAEHMVKPANYTAVDEQIRIAGELTKENYVNFEAVEAAIQQVVRGKMATEQAMVDGYATAIEEAISQLELKDADYAKVDAALEKVAELVKENYVNFELVEAAKEAVVRGKKVDEQELVNGYAIAIEEAISQLELKDADYAKVDAALEKVAELVKENYVNFELVEAAKEAVVRGKKVDEQELVNGYATAIEEAISQLERAAVELESNGIHIVINKPKATFPLNPVFTAEKSTATLEGFKEGEYALFELDINKEEGYKHDDTTIVRIPIAEGKQVFKAIYLEEGNMTELPFVEEEGYAVFEVPHFSTYGIIYHIERTSEENLYNDSEKEVLPQEELDRLVANITKESKPENTEKEVVKPDENKKETTMTSKEKVGTSDYTMFYMMVCMFVAFLGILQLRKNK